MVYSFRPVDLSFEFEQRPYQLGDIIDLDVRVEPRVPTQPGGVRVELKCRQQHDEKVVVSGQS